MAEAGVDEDAYSPLNDEANSIASGVDFGASNRSPRAWLSYMITSLSNFSVQYNFQAISVALLVMSREQCTSTEEECAIGKQSAWVTGTASATVFAGAIFGQLTMGYLGDLIGRNKAIIITLFLAACAALGSAVIPFGSAASVYVTIIICRFVLGIGLGGVYPLSATKAAEDAAGAMGDDGSEVAVDSTNAAKSFFWQAPGAMTPWLIGVLMTYNKDLSTDARWRLLLGLGSIPAFLVVLGSWYENRYEPERLNTRVSISISHSASHDDMQKKLLGDGGGGGGGLGDIPSSTGEGENRFRNASLERVLVGDEYDDRREVNIWLIMSTWRYQRKLIATGLGWFLYDVCFYGVSLFGGEILNSIGSKDDDDVTMDKNIRETAGKQLIALGMAIPAVLLTILGLTYMPTKYLQVIGFGIIAFMFLLLAFLVKPLEDQDTTLFTIYCFLLFSLNFGPNVTTFVLPAESYPKGVRATCNGISAAMGKLGAVVGAYMFGPLALATSFTFVFITCAGIAIVGMTVGWLFIDLQKPHGGKLVEDEDTDDDDMYFDTRDRASSHGSYRRDSGGDYAGSTGSGAAAISLSRTYQPPDAGVVI